MCGRECVWERESGIVRGRVWEIESGRESVCVGERVGERNLSFFKAPDGVQFFPGGGGVQLFPGGVQLLIPYRNPFNL